MTPPEKTSRNGQEAEPAADQTTVLASDEVRSMQPAAGALNGGASNGAAAEPPATETEELELGHAASPPPWQRVRNEAAFPHPDGPDPDGPTIGVEAPAMERPVVTGTAASRLFEDATPPRGIPTPPSADLGTPPHGLGLPPQGGYLPPRTTVHLEGTSANATTGTMRATPAASPNALRRPGRGPRRANLQIKRFDPWSVLKLSLVLGVALFFVWLVAVGALYAVLDGMGVWDKVNGISTDLLQGNEGSAAPLISAGRVFGIAAIVGAINIVLFSALATVGAFVYNVSADLAGGLEVTLAERE